jgi:hypothetical protein
MKDLLATIGGAVVFLFIWAAINAFGDWLNTIPFSGPVMFILFSIGVLKLLAFGLRELFGAYLEEDNK